MGQNQTKSDRPEFVILDGSVVPFADAKISIMAPGFTFAAAVFEGLRAYWNEDEEQLYVFHLREHLDRLQFSMRVIEMDEPPSTGELADQVIAGLRANDFREDTYIRVQTYIDDWGDMTATGPVGSSVICRRRARLPA
ncbi:MAG: branched-chain amino acid aminotransferase, partial [Rhodospirillales bacterium]|nr:branched-chain amino acid aminotransferase [Rhodospirillales bacterium]